MALSIKRRKRKKTNFMKRLWLSISIVLLLSACESQKEVSIGTSSTKEKGDKEVVVAVPQDPDYLDPFLAQAAGTREIMFNVFEGLLKTNNKGELIPAIAKSYKISQDGLTYTFVLRDGVKFHNGQEVTAEDVKYSYDLLAGIGTGKPLYTSFSNVESITAPDKKTVVIKLKQREAAFLTAVTAAVIPKGYKDSNKTPIGTGPFKFVEYLPGQRLVLEKNPYYYVKGVPYLDKVEFRIIKDAEAAFLAFKSGEIDIYPRIGSEKLDELGKGYKYVSAPQNLVQLLAFNHKRKPFNNKLVRQAINYAIDKDEIIKGVALGKGTKIGSNMSPIMGKYYQEGLEDKYAFNIKKAKKLLAKAGYPNGFETTITVPSNYQFHVDTAQVVARYLEKIGIKAKIETVEWGVWLDRVYQGRDYDMTIIGLDGKLDPYEILNKYLSTSKNNFFNFSNTQFDQVLEQARTAMDENKRVELIKKAQTILAEEAAAVYIMDPNTNTALKDNLEGYKTYPIYVQDLSTIKVKE